MNGRSSRKQMVLGLCVVFAAGVTVAETAESAEPRPAAKAVHPRADARHPLGSYTQTTRTQRTDDGYTRDTTHTDKNGNTATREADLAVDPVTGTKTRDVTYTGRDGDVRNSDTTTQRTADGHTSTSVVTDAQGRTATREADVVHDADTHTTVKTVTVNRQP